MRFLTLRLLGTEVLYLGGGTPTEDAPESNTHLGFVGEIVDTE